MAATYTDLDRINLPALTIRSTERTSEAEVRDFPAPIPQAHTAPIGVAMQRRGHTTTALLDGSHFVFGGYGLPSSTSVVSQLNLTHSRLSHAMLIRRPKIDRRSFIEALPQTSSTPGVRMYHTALRIIQQQAEAVMIFGGRTSPRAPLSDLNLFDVKTLTWSQIKPDPLFMWPDARYRHAAVSLTTKEGKQLSMIHGGRGRDADILSDTWIFDSDTLRWTRASFLDDLIGPRHSHQMWFDPNNSTLFIFGGVATNVAGVNSPRIAPNIKVVLQLAENDNFIQCATCSALELQSSSSSLTRYSHKLTAWKNTTLLMSGGLTESGVIPPQDQCCLLDVDNGQVRQLNMSACEPRCFVDHTATSITLPGQVESQNDQAVAMILGGGTTCFSFGSRFDESALLVSDLALSVSDMEDNEDRGAKFYNSRHATFTPDAQDTWNCATEVRKVKAAIDTHWQNALSVAEPVVFQQLDLGDCLTEWTPTYLKKQCGELRCSVHLSDEASHLTWHQKNFKYTMMSFGELIDRTLGEMTPSPTVYLRSLSTSPRQASDLSKDFPKLSHDFHIPDPLREIVTNKFFSSVLRISGVDMG